MRRNGSCRSFEHPGLEEHFGITVTTLWWQEERGCLLEEVVPWLKVGTQQSRQGSGHPEEEQEHFSSLDAG